MQDMGVTYETTFRSDGKGPYRLMRPCRYHFVVMRNITSAYSTATVATTAAS